MLKLTAKRRRQKQPASLRPLRAFFPRYKIKAGGLKRTRPPNQAAESVFSSGTKLREALFLDGFNGQVGNLSSYLMLSRQPESGFKMAVWWNIL